jgi:hypothetical protein
MRIDYNLAPGAVQSGVLSLANTTANPVRVAGSRIDVYLDETATPQFGEYKQEASRPRKRPKPSVCARRLRSWPRSTW